jgi:hypothetical protein
MKGRTDLHINLKEVDSKNKEMDGIVDSLSTRGVRDHIKLFENIKRESMRNLKIEEKQPKTPKIIPKKDNSDVSKEENNQKMFSFENLKKDVEEKKMKKEINIPKEDQKVENNLENSEEKNVPEEKTPKQEKNEKRRKSLKSKKLERRTIYYQNREKLKEETQNFEDPKNKNQKEEINEVKESSLKKENKEITDNTKENNQKIENQKDSQNEEIENKILDNTTEKNQNIENQEKIHIAKIDENICKIEDEVITTDEITIEESESVIFDENINTSIDSKDDHIVIEEDEDTEEEEKSQEIEFKNRNRNRINKLHKIDMQTYIALQELIVEKETVKIKLKNHESFEIEKQVQEKKSEHKESPVKRKNSKLVNFFVKLNNHTTEVQKIERKTAEYNKPKSLSQKYKIPFVSPRNETGFQ